jgi:ribosome-associated translation inhibitor RaiA
MQLPLQITFRNMETSDALEERIREKAKKLDSICDTLLSCRVVVEAPHKHKQTGGLFHTMIDITLPGETIVINREPDKHHSYTDAYVSVRDAFDTAQRLLRQYVNRRKGHVKTHEEQPVGRISVLFPEEDYGRIIASNGDDIYFHRNSILNADFDALEEGNVVSFVEQVGDEGLKASSVRVIGKNPVVESNLR